MQSVICDIAESEQDSDKEKFLESDGSDAEYAAFQQEKEKLLSAAIHSLEALEEEEKEDEKRVVPTTEGIFSRGFCSQVLPCALLSAITSVFGSFCCFTVVYRS
jgi:hypothetical protein